LANIYLHELDVFTQDEIIPKYTAGEKRLVDKASIYRRNHVLKSEITENPRIQELPQLKKSNKKILNNDVHYYNSMSRMP
jgi:hypothetical protein